MFDKAPAEARAALRGYFQGPDGDRPEGLIADLFRIAELGNAQGLELLLEAARRLGVAIAPASKREEEKEEPKQVALRCFLDHPQVFNEASDLLSFATMGELVTMSGYHPETRLLHEPPAGFELPPVPEQPGAADIASARSLLLDDLMGDFPFTSEAERAHALALLLLPFVRPLIEGPTPLHLIEKPTPGTGATLLVDAIAVVATGHSASIMTEGRDEEEWRKRLTAKLRSSPLMIVIDNLRRPLDAGPLAAALAAPYWEDRILGRSDIVRIPVRCAWVATGNNPQLSNEIARRTVRIRLDAHMDRPWQRDGFRHPNLLAWIQANRGPLVAACLTLGRAWVEAGRPRYQRTTLGSFESWSEVVGGILDVVGVPGFLTNADELYETSDAEGIMWRSFVAAWGIASARRRSAPPICFRLPENASRRCRSATAATAPSGPALARPLGRCAIACSPSTSFVCASVQRASPTKPSAGSL